MCRNGIDLSPRYSLTGFAFRQWHYGMKAAAFTLHISYAIIRVTSHAVEIGHLFRTRSTHRNAVSAALCSLTRLECDPGSGRITFTSRCNGGRET